MSNPPDWLPEPLQYVYFGSKYEKFFATVYEIFERDFKQSRPNYGGRPVTYDSRIEDGKEAAFWHVTTSTDDATGERLPDFRRSERISWLRAIIEHPDDKALKVWREDRGGEGVRIHLWLEEFDYLVVLGEGARVMVIVTAFYIESNHMRRNLRKRWEEFSRKQTPPRGAT